jgi:hypothetical protein
MRDFFRENNRAEWNTKLFDYFNYDGEAKVTIEDYFGIWTRLVSECGPSNFPGEPLIYQDCSL